MAIGVPPNNPTKYIGPKFGLIPIRYLPRTPTTADNQYNVGQFVLLEKNPVTGDQGDLWYLSKFDSSGDPVWIQVLSGAGSPGISTVTTDDGADPVEPDGNGNINIVGGTGISVTGNGPGDTVTVTADTSFTWTVVTGATQTISASNGYFANRAGGVAFTLPATAAVGDCFEISAMHADGWTLAQNASQAIRLGNTVTTTGVGGSLASTAIGNSIRVVCNVANTSFIVQSSMGNITIV